jgi:hypothetical protein
MQFKRLENSSGIGSHQFGRSHKDALESKLAYNPKQYPPLATEQSQHVNHIPHILAHLHLGDIKRIGGDGIPSG